MAMQLLEAPNYIKRKELKPDTYAFESFKYVSSKDNPKSKYPGTPGAINHTFKDETGKKFVIGGDTVFNRLVEDELEPGMLCSFFYLGKVDNDGEDVNYHNWRIAFDPEEQDQFRSKMVTKAAPAPAEKSNLDDLE